VFAFVRPILYVLFRINKPEIFKWSEFGEYIIGAFLITIVIWLIYGIFCLVAQPSQSESTEKSMDLTLEQGQDAVITTIIATHNIIHGKCKKCKCTEYYIKKNNYKCPK
jgi:hypothetical protein